MQRFKFQASLMLMLSALLATPSVIAAPPAQPAPLALLSNDIAMVEASSFSQSLALTGTLQPWQQTQLSAEIEAAVEDVYVRPGEAVKKGQVLLRFDLRDVKARLAAQQAQLDATKAQLTKRGVTPVLYEGLTRGEKDFSAVVTKIRAAGADVVYFGGLHPEAGPLVRQMREQGLKDVKFMSDDGIVTDELVTTAGGPQYVDGVYMTFGADPRLLPDSKTVVDAFRKAGTEPEGYTLYAYASVQALAAGFNGAKSNKGEDAAKWLKANPVKTVMGEKTWDAKGDLKVSDYVVYQWDKDGKYHQLEKQK